MPAAHKVKFEEKSGGDAVCAAALATVKAAAMQPARSCAVEANLDIVLSLVGSPAGSGRTCSRMKAGGTLLAPLNALCFRCFVIVRRSLHSLLARSRDGNDKVHSVSREDFRTRRRPIGAPEVCPIRSIASGCQVLRQSRRRFGPCARSRQCRPAPAYSHFRSPWRDRDKWLP